MSSGIDNMERQPRVIVNRPVYNQKEFDKSFLLNKENVKSNRISTFVKKIGQLINITNILGVFTIFDLITRYDFKKTLIPDILSGLTVGVMHIPAGLAYGALTSLNPVNGLYTSFYCSLVYVLFGTSRHLSVGTYAVTSLMVFSCISKLEEKYMLELKMTEYKTLASESMLYSNNHTKALESKSSDLEHVKLKIATALAFWCGFFQILFCFLNLGTISKYLSQPLLRGFTTGCSFHVFTSQVRHLIGVYNPKRVSRRVFKIIHTYINIFKAIGLINWCTVFISVVSITFLILMKTQVNERFKKQLRNIPIPIELIVIITGTLVTYLAKLDEKFHVPVIGKIPEGFPQPALPDFKMFFDVMQDAFVIAVVAFASSISVADLYAKKHKYKINSNRELFALGMSNVVGSFFKCFVSCGALARSAVLEQSGGKTQLVSIIASIIVMMVMLWISPLLATLPKACLGSIIIAAIINIMKQLKDLPYYWRIDKIDFIVWTITLICTTILDVDLGLMIGVLTVLFFNTYRNQNINLNVIGHVNDHEIYSDVKKYLAKEYDQIKIIRPSHPIIYVNSDKFRADINNLCPLKDSKDEIGYLDSCLENYGCTKCFKKMRNEKNNDDQLNNTASGLLQIDSKSINDKKYKIIILDCVSIQFIDEAGFKCLKEVIAEYEKENIQFLLTNCNDNVLNFFKNMNYFYNNLDEKIYLTIQDAIIANRNNN